MRDNLKKLQRFSKFYIEFHEKIFSVQVKCMQHLVAVLPFQKLSNIDIDTRLNQKKPILGANNLIIDDKNFEHIFDNIFPVLKKYSYRKKEQLQRLEELNDKRRFSLKQLATELLGQDKNKFSEFSTKYDISPLLSEMVAELISAPYFELCAEYFNKKVSNFRWREPYCPVCGSLPSMARINEQTRTKILWCHLCDTSWTFYDKVCPYCLNGKIETQEFIFPSNRKPFRIEACNNCNNYLKTVDELVAHGDVNFSVVNIATYYLDLLAKKYGYNLNNYFKFYFESS